LIQVTGSSTAENGMTSHDVNQRLEENKLFWALLPLMISKAISRNNEKICRILIQPEALYA